MRRICTIRHKYYPAAVPTRRNAETLISQGYEVDIICLRNKGEKKREVINGVNVYRLPVMHRREGIRRYVFEYVAFFFLAFWQITWLSLIKKYEIVQIDNMPDFLVFTTLLPRLRGAKVILEILDHTPEVFMDGFKVGPDHLAVRVAYFLEKISIRWADHIIVTQSTSRDILVGWGVSPLKISVVLNVPDEKVFKIPPATVKNNGHFQIMTHGRIVERYNVRTLINAVPLLKQHIPNLEVKIIGDGEGLAGLKTLADSLGVNNIIRFTGLLKIEEIPAHIAEADVCIVVIPAGANPAMPNKLFEYSALGKPAVVTSIPAIKPYYDDTAVMYYEPGDVSDLVRCVLELYRNPEKREMLGSSSAAVYQKYRWDKMKHEYLKTIDNLLNHAKNNGK